VEQSVRDHCAEIERCNQRGGRMLSVVDLIEAGTMTQDTHDTDKETRCWGAGMLIRSISKKTLTPILRSHGWGYLAPCEVTEGGFRYAILEARYFAVIPKPAFSGTAKSKPKGSYSDAPRAGPAFRPYLLWFIRRNCGSKLLTI